MPMSAPQATRRSSLAFLAVLLLTAFACGPRAGTGDNATFAGSTIRIIVGYPPGGGYDLHGRLVANHLGKFLPGHPSVIVENMPGAGGGVAANYLATAAAADGLTIGLYGETSAPDLVESGLLERLALLGSPGASAPVIVFGPKSGIRNVDDWRRATTPPRIGSAGGRALSSVVPRVAAAALGLPVQIVSGYAGISEIRVALESGEVDACAFDSAILRSDQLRDATLVLRFGSETADGSGVPDALTLAPDDRATQLLEAGVYDMRPFGRVFAAPRQVPAERLALLRSALANAWSDAKFLAEARAAGLLIAPIGAEALERALASVVAAKDDRLHAILRN